MEAVFCDVIAGGGRMVIDEAMAQRGDLREVVLDWLGGGGDRHFRPRNRNLCMGAPHRGKGISGQVFDGCGRLAQ